MKSLLLICALGLSHADCTIDTAAVVIQGPEGAGPAQCAFMAQAYLASTSIAGYLQDRHFLKIACSPETPPQTGIRRADRTTHDGRALAAR